MFQYNTNLYNNSSASSNVNYNDYDYYHVSASPINTSAALNQYNYYNDSNGYNSYYQNQQNYQYLSGYSEYQYDSINSSMGYHSNYSNSSYNNFSPVTVSNVDSNQVSSNNNNNQSTPVIQNQMLTFPNAREKESTCNEHRGGRNLTIELDMPNELAKSTRKRTNFTTEQRHYLLAVFTQNKYPSRDALEFLAKKFGVKSSVIQTWFKNTRSKQKMLTNTKNL